MKCVETTEFIHRMIFEDVQPDASVIRHLEECVSCRQLYSDALTARRAVAAARRDEPLLAGPGEFTDGIMAALDRQDHPEAAVLPILRRLLAAASVALCLLFAYEQSGIVRQLLRLESQCSKAQPATSYSAGRYAALAGRLSRAGISFTEMERMRTPAGGPPVAILKSPKTRTLQTTEK